MAEITAKVTARRMQRAAAALLQAMTPEQRAAATFARDDEDERRRWSYYPRQFHGLPLLAMTGAQQKLAGNLLEAALSVAGHARVAAIMGLENILDRLERHARDDRDSGRYYFSVFGTPSDSGRWAWRFEGHHVSLHFSLAGDTVLGYTPNFLGANPARVGHGGAVVLRPLAEEEDLGRELMTSLDSVQRRQALIASEAPPDLVLANVRRLPERAVVGQHLDADFPPGVKALIDAYGEPHRSRTAFDRTAPRGISGEALGDGQRDLLFGLVRAYVDRLPDDLASAAMAELGEDVVPALHFAWAGSLEPRQGHYYRVQGPRLLIEYDNTQNDANHVHAVWRDPENDFGDLLIEHYLRDHPA